MASQVANALEASATFAVMSDRDADGTQAHRRARLEALVALKHGGNKTSFAHKLGLRDAAYLRQMLTGLRPISEKQVEKIEDAFRAKGWFSRLEANQPAAAYLTEPASVTVPLLAASASMGDGDDQQAEDVVVGRLTLSADWVQRHIKPTRPDALCFLHGMGDSMAPTFRSGDILLVDNSVRAVRVDGVYVLRAHDRLFVKRVRQRIDGQFEISSDNPNVKTIDVLGGSHPVEVLGRVVFTWTGVAL
jgi:phage repressor protein C with HTH and peptisase S24 domain